MPLPEQMESSAQQYCLRWKYHHSNLQVMFAQLLERESFCDVTLACEGKTLRAHKMVLSACSTYFDAIFSKHEEKDPIVILKDVKFDDIKALVEFMYKGEINVENWQLNTLLQTAEELRIKGLAAVSWRAEGEGGWRAVENDMGNLSHAVSNVSSTNNSSIQSSQSPQSQIVQSQSKELRPSSTPPNTHLQPPQQHVTPSLNPSQVGRKRKIKSENEYFSNLKVARVSNQGQLEDPLLMTESCDEDSQEAGWESRSHEDTYVSENEESKYQSSTGSVNNMCIPTVVEGDGVVNTEAEHPELMDVIKMTAYIQQGGRRPHFWETSSTKRVMEAIKNKEIEMKVAAELLGVSYGTLYGRYRDAYGCLKHPYRVREFWHEPPSVEVIAKLQRKEVSLFKAAEMLNVTVTTLANYLAALNKEEYPTTVVPEDEDDEVDSVTSAQQALSKNPDITIVKKEKIDDPSTSVNGNE